MRDGSQGIARAQSGAPRHALLQNCSLPNRSGRGFRHRSYLAAMDATLFVGRYVLLAADNTSPKRVTTCQEAQAALAAGKCASIAGRLAEGLLGADIDASQPVIGDACAEVLVAWCIEHGLPYVVRESGRPGGRHVIAVVTDPKVPVRQWPRLCRRLSKRYGTTVQDRTGQHLRLLSAPHRIGLPAPVISCTATPANALDAVAITRKSRGPKKFHGGRRVPHPTFTGAPDGSRSAVEWGLSCAMARAGYSTADAWTTIAELNGKAREQGQRWWRRYVWLSAVTTVAAERGLTEEAAWDLVRQACPAECLTQGYDWWRNAKWEPALAEAQIDRPRRYRLDDTDETSDLPPEVLAEIEAVRTGFETAVAERLAGLHPQRLRSVRAVLSALARAVVTRSGSISTRSLSLRARCDRKTVQRALATSKESGILVELHAYAGGSMDCSAYGIGPAAIEYVSAAHTSISPTRCTTPAPLGRAHLPRLRGEYLRDRTAWAARCDVLASLAPGERLADSSHPVAKLLRSRHFQKRWWQSLTMDEQTARQEARRRELRAMEHSERSVWFTWLARRELICNAADRLLAGNAAAGDLATLRAAPLTIHRGMSDPRWLDGGTPASAAA